MRVFSAVCNPVVGYRFMNNRPVPSFIPFHGSCGLVFSSSVQRIVAIDVVITAVKPKLLSPKEALCDYSTIKQKQTRLFLMFLADLLSDSSYLVSTGGRTTDAFLDCFVKGGEIRWTRLAGQNLASPRA